MATGKTRLHRLTAHVLFFSLAADPFALAQIQTAAAARNGIVADLHTAALLGGVDSPSPTAAAPAEDTETTKGAPPHRAKAGREAATPFVASTTGPAGSGEKATTCAESLTQHRAPLVSLVKTLLWPANHSLVDVGLDVNVTAPCEGRVTTRVAVFADEPDEDQTGDGNVPGDARIDGKTLYLRSERKGDANGRVYLVLTTSTLPDGTSGTACATVTVPRSRSQADLASVSAQASAAQAYCDAHLTPPASYFELAKGVLTLANVPPVVDAGPDQAVDFPDPTALHGTATDDGRPNGTLSVSWSKVDGPGAVAFNSPNTAETTASFSEAGTYTLRLTANDGQLSESDDVVVAALIANEAPHVDAGPDQEITLPEATATLDGSATDDGKPVGSSLKATWSVLSPAGAAVAFADVNAPQTTATLPGAGEYVLRLTADDGQFAVGDETRVTVHAQPPPVLGVGDAAVPEGHEGTTAAVITLALSYAWSRPVTVDYMTEDGTAVAGCDYRTAYGTVTFVPGQTTAEILVPIAGELAAEEDETVRLRVDNVSQATLERTEATLTILNDDSANRPPGALSSRTPADRANGVVLPPTLTWSAVDPDAGDVLTHDVHLGPSFATTGQSWARTCPASQGPGPRTAPVAGYDEAGDRMILFGGTGTTDGSLWILANASAAGGPPQWTSIPTSGGPVGLSRAASVYDAATNRLFVVGGCSGDCLEGSGQTWVLANANGLGGTPTWSLLAGAQPGPRMDHAAAIDPATRRLIVFGGSDAGASLGDVWLLSDLDGQPVWQELPTDGTGPARSGMSASYDGESNVLLVFGGRAGAQALNDTWMLSNANGNGGNALWSRLTPAGTTPPARWGHVAAYDPVADRLVVYGGSTASANPASRFVFRDVWMLAGTAGGGAPEWIRLHPNAGPTGQVQAAGAFSVSANRLVVVGGTSSTSTATDEVWVLSDAIGTLPLVTSGAAASFTADGLVPGAMYHWRIISRDDHGAARGSTAWRFTSNAPPTVDAGPDQEIRLPDSASLSGTASDDGLPTGVLTFTWTASGPGQVAFSDPSSAVTTATFGAPGRYVLRLTLGDSQLSASDELTVTVLPGLAAGRTWTTTGDFSEGQSLHVNGGGDQVRLDGTAGAYPFVWIAVSSKGTIVKIDARTGAILGEYNSAPDGQPRNPSRTTVDLNGNVWTGNRDGNSVVHIGNEENGQCVDRNGNGVIDTSRGFGDRRPWTNAGGADTDGGISTAADECILHYTRVSAQGTRHLSVTRDNDVWVSGELGAIVPQPFDLVDGRTGFIKRSEPSVGYGGYGGLIDRNGVIWSARPLLRWDPALPLAGPNGGNWKGFGHDSYGLCIDPQGNVWETALYGPATGNPATTGTLRKWAPDGTLLGTFGHGYPHAQGCAADARGDVWVAHVLWGSNTVGHVKNDGTFVGNVTVPSGPTGVAVDLDGKIWSSNHNSRNVSRIDPNAGAVGADGVTRVGAVDFTTPDLGGNPYNYSDMTGSTLVGAPREGRWSVVFDSGTADAKWGLIRWSESRCGDGSLSVRVASSPDGLTFTADQPAASGQGIPVPDGRYLRVAVTFTRATTGESPVLYDLSVGTETYTVPGDDADQPPQVDAGPDQAVETPNEASLSGSACDDGRPSGALDVSWSKVSGPGDVRFSDPIQPETRARFRAAGSFDAVEDFSETTNPSGPWSYGWKPTRTGTFTPGVPSMYYGMPGWLRMKAPDPGGDPVVAKGPRGQTYVFAANSVFLPAELLDLHPGGAGQNAVVRWTAPAAGSYRIEGRFQGISILNPTVDVAILHNAATVFAGNITSFGQAAPFTLVRDVVAGDVVDFSVGFGNGSFNNDSTGLAVRVEPVGGAGVDGTYVLRLSAGDAAGSAQDEVTVTVTTPECAAPPAGTVGWWPADGHATDLLGGPSGTLAGGMGYGAGMVGQAFLFDGVDDTVTIPASPALNVQAFTLEGWVFPTDPRLERPIFEYASSSVIGVHLWQNLSTAAQRTPGALFANLIDAGGSSHILATGAGVLVPSTWNHVALTYDPASGKARLYANGRLEVEFGAGTFVPKTNLPFNVGHRPGSGFRFAGGIDEAAIVGRALAPAEIQEIYFAGALGKCRGSNRPPQVDAGADQEILLPLQSATLAGTVSDDGLPEGVALEYRWTKVSGPGTVTFSAPASLATSATFSTAGEYTLQLEADDSELKGSDTVHVSVRPRAGNAAPVVDAGPDRTLTLPANSLTLTGTATDDGLPLGSTLSFQWSVAAGPGVVTFGTPAARETTTTFSDPGVYVLKLTASDGEEKGSDQAQVTVGAAAPVGNPPQVALSAPLDGARVTSLTGVVGTVQSDALASWKLEYRLEGDTTYTRLAAGTTAVTAAPLGTFDPSLLLNGIYEVRLTGTDTAGRSSRIWVKVVVKDNLKLGHFSVSFVDLDVPVAGLPIQVRRTYDSRDKGEGDFGIGWRLEMSNVRLAEKGVVGHAFEGVRSPGPFPTYCLQPARPQVVTVTLTDGTVYEFQPVLTPSCQQFVPLEAATVTYQPLPGTHARLAAAGDGYVFVDGSWPGAMDLYDGSTFEIYDPDDYVLTLEDGSQLFLNQATGLKRVQDLNGNTLTVSSSGITHSSGRGITFARDAQGRITQVTSPDNHSMTYGYDAAGDLVSFTDRETNTTTFTYSSGQPHLLETIQDPLGKQPIRNEYYDDGRIKSHTDAFGKTITYAHDLTGRQEVITDRDGGVRVLEFDERGNVVRETDPEGKVVDRTFDARNNRTSETLPHDPGVTNPPKTTYVYDALDDLRSVTDPENHTTEYAYNARKQVVLMKDPRGTYTLNAYDAMGNLLSTKTSTSPTGSPVLSETSSTYRADGSLETRTEVVDGVACVTRYEYDGSGYLVKETDGLGHVTSFTYDGSGHRLTRTTTRTTPAGVETLTTTYEYDKMGRLLKATDSDDTFIELVYDALGRKKETRDKLGRVTKHVYDDMGRLVLTTYPDLTTEEATYDGEGNRLTFKDRAGRVTTFQYDKLGRLTKTTYPDESFTESVYDSAGRVKETKDARGNTTFYGYDAAGRQTSVKVPLGGGAFAETVFTYDANGNQKTVRDANLHTVTYEYDEHNRQTKTILPDGTYRETTYDVLGRHRVERDQAGKLTKFDYDCLGRLTKVTQSNDGVDLVTRYEYDEAGNRTLQRDGNGHETRFEYDGLGRETARTLPDGKRETRTYWPTGSLKTRTDFMGRTTSYDYDENERLTTRTYPAGTLPAVSFTYTPTGQRKTVTVAGETTRYEYDLLDRLKTLSYPDGRTLAYDYDGNGNRTTLKATIGGQTLTTSFLYDPANRLDLVTDFAGRTYDHGYDPAGNRKSLAHPNGVTTTYDYDDLNRLRDLATTHLATGVTIQGYGFTLGPSGNRTKITERDGTVREYGYDDLYRLTSEKVTMGALPQYEKTFTYDAVGNRKTQTTHGTGAAGTPLAAGSLTYAYDTRDRLETESGTQAGQPIGVTYGYDDNGNLITRSGEATYVWDVENRLTRVETGPAGSTTVLTYAYDADGNRLQTRVTPPTGPPTVTQYLVDTSGSLSHVVAETDGTGALKAYYVRGDDLLAVLRPLVSAPATPGDWQARFVHADGVGSIRRLTDESGGITDGYAYTAFGERIAHTGTDPQPYAFAGEPYDPNSGFSYNRARWLSLAAGRFVSVDPWSGSILDPPTLHRYVYVRADPVNRVDPTGLVEFTLSGLSLNSSMRQTLNSSPLSQYVKFLTRGLRDKRWDIFVVYRVSNVHSLIPHFSIYALYKLGIEGLMYDVGPNRVGPHVFIGAPGSLRIRPAKLYEVFGGPGIKVKVAELTIGQYAMWNIMAGIEAFQMQSMVPITYSFFGPLLGKSCISWTLQAAVTAFGLQVLPLP